MIMYKFNEVDCKIDFKDFLSLTTKKTKLYKKDFEDLYSLYEFIEFNLNKIEHILFDGYEYYLEKGKLHNLYGPAIIKHVENQYFSGPSRWFYINGKKIYDDINSNGCRKLENFENKEIFHFQEITNLKSGRDDSTGLWYRRKEDIDYKKYPVNLKRRIEIDQRKRKLEHINLL